MAAKFLHRYPNFKSLIEIVAEELEINEPSLVEKDYWLTHVLFGLQQVGLKFELKGGTSLSKGHKIIHRFSEDIDIRIDPDEKLVGFKVYTGKNHDTDSHRQSRKNYYDWLAKFLNKKIDGIEIVERDEKFDDPEKMRNGGIRLKYETSFLIAEGIKEGILLEVGFDRVTPNRPTDISSWIYDKAMQSNVEPPIDSRALKVHCYDPQFTFVEKLQTVIRKYRIFKRDGKLPDNFIRHYYDIYQLLEVEEVKNFIGTEEYNTHKVERFKGDDPKVSNSEAFKLSSTNERALFEKEYLKTKALYYKNQPSFDSILNRIGKFLESL